MNKYRKKRLSVLMLSAMLLEMLCIDTANAMPVNELLVYAGEAQAIQGDLVSVSVDDIGRGAAYTPKVSGNTVVRISTAPELMELSEKSFTDAYSSGKTFELTQDIDMSNYTFKTITSFAGVFNGNGHEIRGLNYGGDGYVSGLFRYVSPGGVIQNLRVRGDVTAVDDEMITGGICGINEGVISNCVYEGSLKGKSITGGIAAINEVSGTIMACTNKGSITGYYYTGGVTGKNYGVTAYSFNEGNINDTDEWVEGADEANPRVDLLSGLLEGNKGRTEDTLLRNAAGTDTGGIAGFSRGAVYQCGNKGEIGYAHTGYNVGGIVGRQSGFVSFCNNSGHIQGRKDIGGIVGQMEPYLTISDLETLPDAVDHLHDLVDSSLDDVDESVDIITDDVKQLSVYADNAVTAGDSLGDSAETYLNSISDAANSLQSRVDYLTDKMPKLFDYMADMSDHLSDSSDSMRELLDDSNVYKKISVSSDDAKELKSAVKKLRKLRQTDSGNEISIDIDVDKIRNLPKLSDDSTIESGKSKKITIGISDDAISERKKLLNTIEEIVIPAAVDAAKTVEGNAKELHDNLGEAKDDLKDGMEYTKDVIEHINSMAEPSMPSLGSDFDAARDSLTENLSDMVDMISRLADHGDGVSDKLTDDFKDVNDQVNVVFHIISDELDRIGDISRGETDEIITDISEEEIDSIEQGRVDHSNNEGIVEGDINIGGIAGAMAIDTDDPEENAAGDLDGGFSDKYLLRNIILECGNDTDVESKKDGAGGIVGYMAHGVIKGCEEYGSVASTEGGYVGGIAGQSESIIKDSYAMVFLDGASYVGGIAGFGTTINGCAAIPSFESTGNRRGSIAGQIETEKETHKQELEAISGNRYYNDIVAGVDNKSIDERAYLLSYADLMKESGIPDGFKKLRIVFMVEDEDEEVVKAGEISLPYGAKLASIQYPVLHSNDGKYAVWEHVNENGTLTAPMMIRGEIKSMEKTLKSEEKYPETDMPAALVSGNFINTDRLVVTVAPEQSEVTYKIYCETEHEDSIEALRLYTPFSKAVLYGVDDSGEEKELTGSNKGSYIEVKGGLSYDTYKIRNNSILDKIKGLVISRSL